MVEITLQELVILFLIFARVVAIVALLPIFGNVNIPPPARVGLALFLTFILFPSLKQSNVPVPEAVFPLLLLFAKEIAIGMTIGFTAVLIFIGVQHGGTIVGMQMGFGIVNVIDPQTQEQTSIIGQVQQLLALLIFLVIDGHHFFIRALCQSFEEIPIFAGKFSPNIVMKLIAMSGEIFEVAIKIGAPVIVALLLTSVGLGILARTVPQMNIFIVSFPLKIGVGMLVLTASLPLFLLVFRKIFAQFQTDFLTLIRLM